MSMVRQSAVAPAALAWVAALSLAALCACSKPSQPAMDQAGSNAASPAAADAGSAGTAAQPGPGKLKLDIMLASGEAIYGDPQNGKGVFNQCASCHAKEAGENRVGPTLHGIIGRHAGQVPGFHYSAANKGSGIVWTEQELWAYLENPQKVVPGTYMTYTGVKDPQKRADVIAYLQENTR
jgi:cytochrome c